MSAPVVSNLWRYPVKSMLGEECEHIELNVRGVVGDRLYAVRDADGKLGSGKNTRRFRQIDGLFTLRAKYAGGWPDITFPDGRCLRGDDFHINSALSHVLGVSVTLARENDISHFDNGPVHLMSTASLDWLRSRLRESRIDERRFRPNIVVAIPGSTPAERSWIGKTLSIGSEVRLQVTMSTERCRMTTLAQGDLPTDPKVLRCIAQDADLQFGVYAQVVKPGRIATGDPVALE